MFTGQSNDYLDRASWKRYWPLIGPGDVKLYIETHAVLEPNCPGSGVECIPPVVNEETGQRRFDQGQLICPNCAESPIHPVCWSYPAHKAKVKDPDPVFCRCGAESTRHICPFDTDFGTSDGPVSA